MSLQKLNQALASALILAALISLARALLISLTSPYGSVDYVIGTLTLIPLTVLLMLPLTLLMQIGPVPKKLGVSLVALLLIFHFLCFHYEAMFGRLPGSALVYYLTEMEHLLPSLNANLPLWLLILEVGLVLVCWLWLVGKLEALHLDKTRVSASLVAVLLVLSGARASGLQDGAYWSGQQPVVWMAREWSSRAEVSPDIALTREEVWSFQRALGHTLPPGSADPHWPMCRAADASSTMPNGRSVILLVLEGVGMGALELDVDGQRVMPFLSQYAKDNLYFKNVFASGTKTAQALVSILTGTYPQIVRNILWERPLPDMQSFVRQLSDKNYETGFFHGGDLSFEQQRLFLRQSGFETIEEYDPSQPYERLGWGFDDGVVLDKAQSWIESQNDPYLATVFTLSTHDPYVLPSDWEPVFTSSKRETVDLLNWQFAGGGDTVDAMLDSYHFLDTRLAAFIDWYEAKERHKGTILVITGDHTPHYWNEQQGSEQRVMTFRVPIIIAGEDINSSDDTQWRLGSTSDISSTVSHLLGVSAPGCDQGLNLLSREWPAERTIYSVGGNSMEKLFIWNQYGQLVVDRVKQELAILDFEKPLETWAAPRDLRIQEGIEFVSLLAKINGYLATNAAYAPPTKEAIPEPLPPVAAPIFVSHRGNVNGPVDPATENSRQAIEAAITAGFEWVEIDFQLTRDGRIVAFHDGFIDTAEGRRLVRELTLADMQSLANVMTLEEVLADFAGRVNLLLEAKPPEGNQALQIQAMGERMGIAIAAAQGQREIIVDSFNPMLAAIINRYCDCEVGLDAPFQQPVGEDYFRWLKDSGFDWVYLHYSVVDAQRVKQAHNKGIKVMAYTVNDARFVDDWRDYYPDGVITDRIEVARQAGGGRAVKD